MMILDNKGLDDNMVDAFSNDTEFLTPSGWKTIDTLTNEDMVAQYDHKDGGISFVRPVLIAVDHTEDVYEITAPDRQARQVVSSRHVIYFEHRDENTGFMWMPRTCEAHEINDIPMNASIRFITSGTVSNHGNGMDIRERIHVAIRESGASTWRDGERTIISLPAMNTLRVKRLRDMLTEADIPMQRDEAGSLMFAITDRHLADEYGESYQSAYLLDFITYEWCRDFMMESTRWGDNVNNNGHGATYRPRHDTDASFYSCISTLSGYESNERIIDGKDIIDVSFESKNISAEAFTVNILKNQRVTGMRVPDMYVITRNGERPVVSGCSAR